MAEILAWNGSGSQEVASATHYGCRRAFLFHFIVKTNLYKVAKFLEIRVVINTP